jgi:hypothetical protein
VLDVAPRDRHQHCLDLLVGHTGLTQVGQHLLWMACRATAAAGS